MKFGTNGSVTGAWMLAALAAMPAMAWAQSTGSTATAQTADTQSIRVGATIFYDYTFTKEPKATDADGNTISANAFNVTRSYINITGNVSRLVSFRITPDIRRQTGTGGSLDGSLIFRLKYAYAQIRLDDWLPAGTQLRVGSIQTPFIESQESVYRYRFQGTAFAERDGGLTSADVGVSLRTPLANNYGDVQVALYNGEGYQRAEANDQKSLQLRATVRPLPGAQSPLRGLRLTAFYLGDHYQKNAERRRFFASALFEHARLNAGFDFLTGTDRTSAASSAVDSKGYSFFVTPFLNEKGTGWEGLLRFDRHDANRDLPGTQRRLIAGAAYWFPHPGGSATAALLFDYEQVTFHDFVIAPPKQQRFAVHGLVNF